MPAPRDVTGAILAGGRGSRAGGIDKGLLEIDGEPAVVRVARSLQPQVARVVVSANRNHAAYEALGFASVPDAEPGFHGPLSGIAAVAARVETPWLLTVPVDCDCVPSNLLQALSDVGIDDVDVCVAHDGERRQPLFALYRVAAARMAPANEAVWRFQDGLRCREAHVAARFANRNTREGASC